MPISAERLERIRLIMHKSYNCNDDACPDNNFSACPQCMRKAGREVIAELGRLTTLRGGTEVGG